MEGATGYMAYIVKARLIPQKTIFVFVERCIMELMGIDLVSDVLTYGTNQKRSVICP